MASHRFIKYTIETSHPYDGTVHIRDNRAGANLKGMDSIIATGHDRDEKIAILNAAKQLAGEDTAPWHTPKEKAAVCVLCGATIYQDNHNGGWYELPSDKLVEVAEMHGALKPLYGNEDMQTDGGFVHAQCGINAGWEVS